MLFEHSLCSSYTTRWSEIVQKLLENLDFTLYSSYNHRHFFFFLKEWGRGTSLAIQWLGLLAVTAEGPARGTKIPQALWHSQKEHTDLHTRALVHTQVHPAYVPEKRDYTWQTAPVSLPGVGAILPWERGDGWGMLGPPCPFLCNFLWLHIYFWIKKLFYN